MPRSIIGAAALACFAFAGCGDTTPSDPAGSPPTAGESTSLEAFGPLTEALDNPDPYARARSLGALLPTLGAESVPAVSRFLDEFRLDLGAVEFELLLRFWATQEPDKATAWTFKHASPIYRTASAGTVVEIWAEADPAAAAVAVESAIKEANEEVARVVQISLVQGWFKTDREKLQQYIYGLGSGVKRQRSLFAYALSLTAADGSDAAIHWAESIPEDDARYKFEVYRQVISALAWADPSSAARFCDAHCNGRFGKGLRTTLIRTRLRNGEDGGSIVEWVAQAPEESEQQRLNKKHALWVAYSTWAYNDRESALAWMTEQAKSRSEPWIRSLYGEYARQLAPDSPEEAIQWAEQIEDEVDRERSLIRIARFWRRQDEAAAEAWLDQSSLSEAARGQARDTSQPDHLPLPR